MSEIKIVEITPVITAGAYSDNDVIGGLLTLSVSMASGFIKRIMVICKDNEKAAINFHIYNAAPTVIADNAAFAPTDADTAKKIARVPLLTTEYTSDGSLNATGEPLTKLPVEFTTVDGNLYCFAVLPTGVSYTAVNDLVFKFFVWPY